MNTNSQQFVCQTCEDTHQVWSSKREQYQMCGSCPFPCQGCRANGEGAYCRSTPCDCQCHQKNEELLMDWYVEPLTKHHIAELRYKLGKCRGIIYHLLSTYKDSSCYDAEEELPTLEQLEEILKETAGD